MDEYLFLTMAKLKADRKRLEQEAREKDGSERLRTQRAEPDGSQSERPSLRGAKFIPLLNWR